VSDDPLPGPHGPLASVLEVPAWSAMTSTIASLTRARLARRIGAMMRPPPGGQLQLGLRVMSSSSRLGFSVTMPRLLPTVESPRA